MVEHKVVINRTWGGFGLSIKARAMIARLLNLSIDDVRYRYSWSDPSEGFRHCPVLVRVVEQLGGKEAHSSFDSSGGESDARLVVVRLKSDRYIINEYDGSESVREPDSICWISATVPGKEVGR